MSGSFHLTRGWSRTTRRMEEITLHEGLSARNSDGRFASDTHSLRGVNITVMTMISVLTSHKDKDRH